MVISLAFSAVVYRGFTQELESGLRLRPIRILAQGPAASGLWMWDENSQQVVQAQEIYENIRKKVLLMLGLLNLGILGLAGAAGYILAGKTLAPIEAILARQKQFVADASHELKTPLTILRSQTEVALKEKIINTTQAKQLLSSNLEEVIKMQSLTNYLLALSRYQDNSHALKMQNFDLTTAILEAIEKNQKALEQKKIKLETNFDTIQIKGNAASATELVSIFLDNAIKYSQSNTQINLRTTQERRSAKIVIEDQGIGIKSSDMPYIFNRFYRADTSRSKIKADGYGLGLAIAKSIVETHKGEIIVKSRPGKGSTFIIKLPV